jgi:hypothetical protein
MGLFVFSSKNSPEAEPSPITAPAEPHTQAPVAFPAQSTPTMPSTPAAQTPQAQLHPHGPSILAPFPQPQQLPYAGLPRPMSSVPSRRSTPPVHGSGPRQRKKYSIRNPESYDNRHAPADGFDKIGRALWKRPSDGVMVNITCPFSECGKSDFRTIHGFTCHMTRVHKDKRSRSHTSVIETFGSESPFAGSSTHPHPPPLPPPPAAGNSAPQSSWPAVNTTQSNSQSNSQSNTQDSTPNQTPAPAPAPGPNHTQDPAQDPAQGQQPEREKGYYQADMVYSDTDDDEDMPQVKLEKGILDDDNDNPPAGPFGPVDKDGDIQPQM